MKTFNGKTSKTITSDIDSTGALDIDASGNVSIDSSLGSVGMGQSLPDGKTLTLGKTGATEMVLAPHGTAGSEKISLTNTGGNAADAMAITSTAGGITLSAGGNITFTGLPTADPSSAGALWNASGTIKISSA